MSLADHAPLVAYTLTLTPGPSALLIAASGARFGLARSSNQARLNRALAASMGITAVRAWCTASRA